MEHSRGVIRRINAGNLIIACAADGGVLRIHLALPGKEHIFRGQRLAIGPFEVWFQLPGNGQAIAEMSPLAALGTSAASWATKIILGIPRYQAGPYNLVQPG